MARDYYSLDTANFASLDRRLPAGVPGTLLRGPIDFRHPSNASGERRIDPDLKPMKLQEVAFGLEHELEQAPGDGRPLHPQAVDRAIEDVGSARRDGNEIYTIGNPGFGDAADVLLRTARAIADFPKAVRDYDARRAHVRQAPLEPLERARAATR